jgi:hypothetical protein
MAVSERFRGHHRRLWCCEENTAGNLPAPVIRGPEYRQMPIHNETRHAARINHRCQSREGQVGNVDD